MGNITKIESQSGRIDYFPFGLNLDWSLTGLMLRLHALLATWHERARQRHQLAGLDGRMFRDIGVSRAEVEHECRKTPWRK